MGTPLARLTKCCVNSSKHPSSVSFSGIASTPCWRQALPRAPGFFESAGGELFGVAVPAEAEAEVIQNSRQLFGVEGIPVELATRSPFNHAIRRCPFVDHALYTRRSERDYKAASLLVAGAMNDPAAAPRGVSVCSS